MRKYSTYKGAEERIKIFLEGPFVHNVDLEVSLFVVDVWNLYLELDFTFYVYFKKFEQKLSKLV